jgi:hypothetical protein
MKEKALAQTEQKPDYKYCDDGKVIFKNPEILFQQLREQPPAAQRTWVGLTDEEIEQGCKESWVTLQAWQSGVWWAEAKLKEKNT